MEVEKLSVDGAPVVDETLARLFRDHPNPRERIRADQGMAIFLGIMTGLSTKLLAKRSGHLAQLECGHYKVTHAINSTGCPRCGAMIRAGYDYDRFRNIDHHDTFVWPTDPLKCVNHHDD